MASQRPTLVLIPGAWHSPEYFKDVIDKLKAHEYESYALHLPSVGGEDTTTVADDAAFIQKTTASLVEAGKDVVIVMHSYGGIPGTESAKGLTKKEREAEGKKGGVVGLVYLSAFVIAEGQSLGSFLGSMPDWIKFDGNRMSLIRTPEVMYNDLPAEVAESYASKVHYHAAPSFATPLTYPAYHHLPTTYLLCKQDQAIPFPAQQAMVGIGGNGVTTHVCDASHCPMLSVPETVVSVIRKAAGEPITVA